MLATLLEDLRSIGAAEHELHPLDKLARQLERLIKGGQVGGVPSKDVVADAMSEALSGLKAFAEGMSLLPD